MIREMSEEEAERYVLGLLGERGRMRTQEFEAEARKRGTRCPDGTVKFLMKLRLLTRIKGGVSVEERGWVWWAEDRYAPGSGVPLPRSATADATGAG